MYRFSAPVFLPLSQGWDLMAGEACLGIAIHCMPGAPGYSLGVFPLPLHDSSPCLPCPVAWAAFSHALKPSRALRFLPFAGLVFF